MKQRLSGAALLLAACLGSCREAAAPQQQIGYSVLTVEPTNVTLTESYSASVRGRQDIEIYPQVSGTIQRVCVKEGEKVQRGQSLFIIDRVPYEAALRTAEANVHAAEAQVETGSGSLRAVFPNPNRVLFSDGTSNVVIPQQLENAISIPQEATYELQDKIFVYRVIDGRAVATRVEVSPIHDGVNYTVTKGLSAGDRIVTTGVGLLNDGDEITITDNAGGEV